MSRQGDTSSVLPQPESPCVQQEVATFQKISPKLLGALEILIGIWTLLLTIWTGFLFLIWSSLITILSGSVTVYAAATRNTCLILISRFLNCFSAVAAVLSIPIHCIDSEGVSLALLLVCDVLIFIISALIASVLCDCCKTMSRQAAITYINRPLPYLTDATVPLPAPPNYDLNHSSELPKYNLNPAARQISNNSRCSADPPDYYSVTGPTLRIDSDLEDPPSYSLHISAPPLLSAPTDVHGLI